MFKNTVSVRNPFIRLSLSHGTTYNVIFTDLQGSDFTMCVVTGKIRTRALAAAIEVTEIPRAKLAARDAIWQLRANLGNTGRRNVTTHQPCNA